MPWAAVRFQKKEEVKMSHGGRRRSRPNNSSWVPRGIMGRAPTRRPPNINQTAATGIQDAIAGARREMAYQPSLIKPSLYNAARTRGRGYGAARAGSTGFNAAGVDSQGYQSTDAMGTGYGAERIGAAPTIGADTVEAGQLAGIDLSPYMNPYESAVVDNTLSDLDRARQLQQQTIGANATAAGAFGGARHALREAENNRNFFDQAARTAATLRLAGFDNAQQMGLTDIGNRMRADLANQGANLQADSFTANLAQESALANQAAANEAAQFGASADNVANLANQAAANQAAQFGAQAANQAAQQASQQQQQANMFGAQAANTANLANAAALNQAAQFGAQAVNQAGLANQAALNQAGLFNAQQRQAAQIANQNAGLAGSQHRLSGANQLGNLSNLGFGMGQTLTRNLAQDGALKQGLNQMLIDAAKNQWGQYTNSPYGGIGLLSQALGASPVPQTTTTSKQPGLTDYATLAAMVAMSDVRLKTNIEPVGKLANGLNLYSWDWTQDAIDKGLANDMHLGVLAQEVEEIMPEAVVYTDSGYMAVDYGKVLRGSNNV